MWSDLRAEINQARQRLQLSEQNFAPLPFTTNWAKLEENLYQVFCRLDHPTTRPLWLWERFRPGAVGLVCYHEPYTRLTSLVDPGEVVWLVLNETVNRGDKFWFYQGTPGAIGRVLAACCYLDEIYLVSKKYWSPDAGKTVGLRSAALYLKRFLILAERVQATTL